MKKSAVAVLAIAALGLTACEDMSAQDEVVLSGLAGAAVGVVTASAFDANPEWTVLAGLAGAAVGTLVARNNQTQECAYARGDGTYRVEPC